MLRENLKDCSKSVVGILTQPLTIPGIPHDTSLYSAAQKYLEDDSSPDLQKMLSALQHYPAALEIMIQELKILSNELP